MIQLPTPSVRVPDSEIAVLAAAWVGIVTHPPEPAEFEQEESEFLAAPEVQDLAEAIIDQHPSFFWLQSMSIKYLWRRAGGASGGSKTLGACVKPSGLARYGLAVDYVIWLAADHCRDLALTPAQYEALVFHELCHCATDEKGRPQVVAHDFEGFRAEIEHYGFWSTELLALRDGVQLQMFREEGRD